ncbi:hypothetical protein CSTAT_08185 [Corynebacterium stationis]|nr:hypothetical protein CSTAT_08185 [Corynebacterium stationis]
MRAWQSVPFALTETYLLPTSLVLVSAKRTWAAWQAREAKDGYVVLKQFGASFEREGDTGMKTVCGNEKSSQPKTARSN